MRGYEIIPVSLAPYLDFGHQPIDGVARAFRSAAMVTGGFAQSLGQPSHVVRVMEWGAALAHELAAWNERRLLRDRVPRSWGGLKAVLHGTDASRRRARASRTCMTRTP